MTAFRAVLLLLQIVGLISIAVTATERGRWSRSEIAWFAFIAFDVVFALVLAVVTT